MEPTDADRRAFATREPPSNRIELESLVGALVHYSRFVPHMTELMRPLSLLRRRKPLVFARHWQAEHDAAFAECCAAVDQCQALQHARPDGGPFILQVDASDVAMGCALMQGEQTLRHWSRAFTDPQSAYSVRDRELYAIHQAVNAFRPYCIDKFVVRTDHANNVQLLGSEARARAEKISPKARRWVLDLAELDFSIEHVPGSDNAVADYLSRSLAAIAEEPYDADGEPERRVQGAARVLAAAAAHTQPWRGQLAPLSATAAAQLADAEVREVRQLVLLRLRAPEIGLPGPWARVADRLSIEAAEAGVLGADEHQLLMFRRDNGRRVPVLGEPMRVPIVLSAHEQAAHHVGRSRDLVREAAWWPGMTSDINSVLKTCLACGSGRAGTDKHSTLLGKRPQRPCELWFVDRTGPFLTRDSAGAVRKAWVLTVKDGYSRMVWYLGPIWSSHARAAVEPLLALIESTDGGHVGNVHADHGSEFLALAFKEPLARLGTEVDYATTANSQSMGAVEREHATLQALIRRASFERQLASAAPVAAVDWPCLLPRIQNAHNSAAHAVTGLPPALLHNGAVRSRVAGAGVRLLRPEEVERARLRVLQADDRRNRARHPFAVYAEGDLVLVAHTETEWKRFGAVSRKLKIQRLAAVVSSQTGKTVTLKGWARTVSVDMVLGTGVNVKPGPDLDLPLSHLARRAGESAGPIVLDLADEEQSEGIVLDGPAVGQPVDVARFMAVGGRRPGLPDAVAGRGGDSDDEDGDERGEASPRPQLRRSQRLQDLPGPVYFVPEPVVAVNSASDSDSAEGSVVDVSSDEASDGEEGAPQLGH